MFDRRKLEKAADDFLAATERLDNSARGGDRRTAIEIEAKSRDRLLSVTREWRASLMAE